MIKKIKYLVLASYSDGELDPIKVNKIVDLLSRRELQQYIRGLKYMEQRSSVIVELPFETQNEYRHEFASVFPNKKVVFQVDPTLLLGMRVTDNDDVYELNLKDTLDSLEMHVEEDYD